jgi:hypothetical protein
VSRLLEDRVVGQAAGADQHADLLEQRTLAQYVTVDAQLALRPVPAAGLSTSPDGVTASWTVIWFSVSVPVLSEHTTDADPSVSTDDGRLTIVWRGAIRCTPSASTTERIAGRPSGTAATARDTPISRTSTGSDGRSMVEHDDREDHDRFEGHALRAFERPRCDRHDGGGDLQVDQRVREPAEEPPSRRKRLLGFELVAAVALQPARRLGRHEPGIRIGVELGDDLSGIVLRGGVRRGQAFAGASSPLPFWLDPVPVTSATR